MRILKKIKAVKTAIQAGWIVSRCRTGCILDDENEQIIPCPVHEMRIAELSKINEGNWEEA